jgi:hypothetical protein
MRELFKVEIEEPLYVRERGEITMTYKDASGCRLDISASGRGLQQTLLLLGHLSLHVGSVLLIDEPDAHLEILRQRQIYQVLADAARGQGSQVVIASHSEVLLNEAAERDVVVAFLGTPHRIDDRGSQVLKSLKEIGFEQYYQAEQTGWVLYLEGATDLAILLSLSTVLEHRAQKALEKPFVHYVMNQPNKAREHFLGLREAYPRLRGFALFDRIGHGELEPNQYLDQWRWHRREIENYFCYADTLLGWAREEGEATVGSLFGPTWVATMESSIAEVEAAMATLGKGSPWSPDTKVSEDFLEPLFEIFFKKLRLPNLMHKTNYHVLARHVPRSLIAEEVSVVLSLIEKVSTEAQPRAEEV